MILAMELLRGVKRIAFTGIKNVSNLMERIWNKNYIYRISRSVDFAMYSPANSSFKVMFKRVHKGINKDKSGIKMNTYQR